MAIQPAISSGRLQRPGLLLDLITGMESDLDSLRRLTEAAARTFSGTAGQGVDCGAVLTHGDTALLSTGNSADAASLAASEDRYDDGPMAQAVETAGPVRVDGGTSVRWEGCRRRLAAAGYGWALAVPLRLEGSASSALLFLGRGGGVELKQELVAEATWFAAVASQSLKLALEVRSVRAAGDNLKAVLESRTSIDVACGVLMAQNRCSYTEAFSKLAGASRQRNLKVRNVAENILKAMPAGPPPARFES
ncbi:ANTAR domain-containing protein [Pseudarthrobacter phenanthrenivorans]|nr:ANTAR domain-containing protein [Pseudarthrobacter phenanthrenivorans]